MADTKRTPTFSRYEIIDELGSGGMGTVYLARHRRIGRLVALKLLPPALRADAQSLQRFEREAQALGRLEHPHITTVYDAEIEHGFPYLAMQYIEGQTLEQRLAEDGPLSLDETLRLGQQMAAALQHVHDVGLIHRDVKASNIMLRPSGDAVLTDFGIVLTTDRSRISRGVLGTLAYMSPEHLDGKAVDARTDQYSLGVVMYECLTGHPPFVSEGEGLSAELRLMQRILNEAPVLPASVPDWLAEVLRQALARDPGNRYVDVEAFAAALRPPAPPRMPTTSDHLVRKREEHLPGIEGRPIPAAPAIYAPKQSSPETWTNGIGMTFVRIPAGTFMMGGSDRYSNEQPVHEVTITKPFDLQTTPVTQAQWSAVMARVVKKTTWLGNDKYYGNPSHFSKGTDAIQRPVEQVSWGDAQRFIDRLNRREGKGYRLPTEAEWEYACRAGSDARYHFGSDDEQLGVYAWYSGNSADETHPVGEKQPNSWGLYDMHGNVWEWVHDWYASDYYRKSPPMAPFGPSDGTSRVLRGGSWFSTPNHLRAARRKQFPPTTRDNTFGFRVAKIVTP